MHSTRHNHQRAIRGRQAEDEPQWRTYLNINLITAKHNRDVLAHPLKVTMPIGYILVRDPRGHVEHDDSTLALDVIPITETSEFLLASGVPDVEDYVSEVGRER